MALREIYSNMLDEGGKYYEEDGEPAIRWRQGTKIKLTFEEGSEFDTIWQNRRNFIKEDEWTWELPNGIKVCENSDTWLKIYKNNILVHEDRDCQTNFSFQDNRAEIDERRLINNYYSTFNRIATGLGECKDKGLLRLLIGDSIREDKFLEDRSSLSDWDNVSNELFEVLAEVVEECGKLETYDFIKNRIVKDKRYVYEGRVINSLSSHVYSYSRDVKVESIPAVTEVVKTKKDLIHSKYNLDFSDIEIKESALFGSSCVADKLNKTIIISDEFNIEEHMSEFIVQYYTLYSNDNIIKSLSTKLEELLRK